MLISTPLKKFLKNAHKKVIGKTNLMNMSKSGKSAYFRHVFANNFFVCNKKKIFKGFEISVKFWVFYTHTEFLKKNFFVLLLVFFKYKF